MRWNGILPSQLSGLKQRSWRPFDPQGNSFRMLTLAQPRRNDQAIDAAWTAIASRISRAIAGSRLGYRGRGRVTELADERV